MATTKQDIERWLANGIEIKAQFMLVVCDTFEYEDYPVYADSTEIFDEKFDHYNGNNMQKIMEVYDLNLEVENQIQENRTWNFPPESRFSFKDVKSGR